MKVLDLVMATQIGQQSRQPRRGNDRELVRRQTLLAVVVRKTLEGRAFLTKAAMNLEPERDIERAVRRPSLARVPLQQHIAFCRPLALQVGIGAHATIVAAIARVWGGWKS